MIQPPATSTTPSKPTSLNDVFRLMSRPGHKALCGQCHIHGHSVWLGIIRYRDTSRPRFYAMTRRRKGSVTTHHDLKQWNRDTVRCWSCKTIFDVRPDALRQSLETLKPDPKKDLYLHIMFDEGGDRR